MGSFMEEERAGLLARAVARGAADLPALEGMQWSSAFSVDERQQMLDELVEAARAAREQQDPSIFNATWKGWAHSADILSDPELRARLTAPPGPERVRLPRP